MEWRSVGFDWNQLRAFLVSAEEGSFSAAAEALGTTQPTIGRQVSALEEALGVTLFERLGRGLTLTAPGVELLEHARAMGEAAMRVSLAATGQARSLEGVVTVTASEAISAYLLPPVVARIREVHPRIELEIVASNAVQDLRRREADVAVRSFQPTDPELIARKIRDGFARMYATPAYLARIGDPREAADLSRAEIFGFDRTELMSRGLLAIGVPVSPRTFPIVTSNHLVQWEMAKRGIGICIMMEEIGDAEPAVQRVLDGVVPPLPVPMWLTSHRELRTSGRVRAVFELLAEELSSGRTRALTEPGEADPGEGAAPRARRGRGR